MTAPDADIVAQVDLAASGERVWEVISDPVPGPATTQHLEIVEWEPLSHRRSVSLTPNGSLTVDYDLAYVATGCRLIERDTFALARSRRPALAVFRAVKRRRIKQQFQELGAAGSALSRAGVGKLGADERRRRTPADPRVRRQGRILHNCTPWAQAWVLPGVPRSGSGAQPRSTLRTKFDLQRG